MEMVEFHLQTLMEHSTSSLLGGVRASWSFFVCVFFTLNVFFYSSISSTPSVRADSSSQLRDTSSGPQKSDTGSYVVSGRRQ